MEFSKLFATIVVEEMACDLLRLTFDYDLAIRVNRDDLRYDLWRSDVTKKVSFLFSVLQDVFMGRRK